MENLRHLCAKSRTPKPDCERSGEEDVLVCLKSKELNQKEAANNLVSSEKVLTSFTQELVFETCLNDSKSASFSAGDDTFKYFFPNDDDKLSFFVHNSRETLLANITSTAEWRS